MALRVSIVDYGAGNLLSVARALEYCGAQTQIARTPAELALAERVVLPGVGAFGQGMHALRQTGLLLGLHDYVQKQRPLLGICLGMQMMLEQSQEFGCHQGLGWLRGDVVPIDNTAGHATVDGDTRIKIPHIGWSPLLRAANNDEYGPAQLLRGIDDGTSVYFVHSYQARLQHNGQQVAYCEYGGQRISAMIGRDHLLGCQFHPEKSGPAGLRILKNFLQL